MNSPGLVYQFIHDIMSAFVGRRNHLLEIAHPVARTICASGKAPIVIVCEHASNNVPDCFHNGEERAVEVGFLHDACDRVAKAALEREQAKSTLRCALNEPYDASDGVTYTFRKHGDVYGLASIMVEVKMIPSIRTTTRNRLPATWRTRSYLQLMHQLR